MSIATAAYDIALRAEMVLQLLASRKDQPSWQIRAERALVRQLDKLVGPAMSQVVANLIRTRFVPTDEAAQKLILSPLADVLPDLVEVILDGVLIAAQHGRAEYLDVDDLEPLPNPIVEALRTQVFEASQSTLNRMVGNVMENISESAKDGVGIDEAARRLRTSFRDMRGYELQRIARTEINGAQSKAAFDTLQEIGVEYHEWVSASDSRTRDSHRDLDGVIVRVGDKFPNGLRYPGDRRGDPSETINCRCRLVPFNMPAGKVPPAGANWFRESDLEDAA